MVAATHLGAQTVPMFNWYVAKRAPDLVGAARARVHALGNVSESPALSRKCQADGDQGLILRRGPSERKKSWLLVADPWTARSPRVALKAA